MSAPAPVTDPEVIAALRRVSTATLTMLLLKRGIRNCWMNGPRPLVPLGERVVGPAFTVRFVPGREDLCQPESYAAPRAFRDAIEAAPEGAVVVLDGAGVERGATLGDILIARLEVRGAVAAVTDSPVRDADEIRKVGLPVLSKGVAAPPSILELAYAGHGELIGCGGVAVAPGDIVVCDNDGAVVMPAHLAAEIAEAGIEQERFERFVQQRVNAGASVMGLYPPDENTLADYAVWTDEQP